MQSVRAGLLASAMACGAIVAATAGPAVASPAGAQAVRGPAAHSVVLVNQPARLVCAGHRFTAGVWFQRTSGGSDRYRVAVSGPRHRRFFYRAGKAPSARWRVWRVLAGRAGKYRTVYSGHRPGSSAWTRYVAVTRARRCYDR